MWDLIGLVRPINPFASFGDITRKIKKLLISLTLELLFSSVDDLTLVYNA